MITMPKNLLKLLLIKLFPEIFLFMASTVRINQNKMIGKYQFANGCDLTKKLISIKTTTKIPKNPYSLNKESPLII